MCCHLCPLDTFLNYFCSYDILQAHIYTHTHTHTHIHTHSIINPCIRVIHFNKKNIIFVLSKAKLMKVVKLFLFFVTCIKAYEI